MRQYVISDPPTITYKEYIKHSIDIPTVVWQQQMEKAFILTMNVTYNTNKPLPFYECDYTKDFNTPFRPLPLIEDYDPHYYDPEYRRDPYWDDELYDQFSLEFLHQPPNLSEPDEDQEKVPPYRTHCLI